MRERLAGLEHAAVQRLQRIGQPGNHLTQRPALVLSSRQAVHLGERLVDAQEAQLGVPEADARRRGHEHGLELRERLALAARCSIAFSSATAARSATSRTRETSSGPKCRLDAPVPSEIVPSTRPCATNGMTRYELGSSRR